MPLMEKLQIIRFDELLSTNNKLKELIRDQDLKEYTIVQTFCQTAGKGQAGNSWESENNKNLTFSLFLKPVYIEIQNQFIISKAVALGILEALKVYAPDFTIKWPNDIYYKNKKIGGILIENALRQNTISESIIGIGLNINQTTFVSDAPNPVSLKSIVNKNFDLDTILSEVTSGIIDQINVIQSGNCTTIHQQYINQLFRKTGYYPYKDAHGEFMAQISGINAYGHFTTDHIRRRKSQLCF